MASEGGGSGGDKGYHFACSLAELQRLGRKRVTVEERVVVLFHVKGQLYALDHFCYRKSSTWFVCLFTKINGLCLIL